MVTATKYIIRPSKINSLRMTAADEKTCDFWGIYALEDDGTLFSICDAADEASAEFIRSVLVSLEDIHRHASVCMPWLKKE